MLGREAGDGSSRVLETRLWHLEEWEWEPQNNIGQGDDVAKLTFRKITGAATWKNFRGEPTAGPELGVGLQVGDRKAGRRAEAVRMGR